MTRQIEINDVHALKIGRISADDTQLRGAGYSRVLTIHSSNGDRLSLRLCSKQLDRLRIIYDVAPTGQAIRHAERQAAKVD